MLKNEITVVGDQCEKQREAKEVLATLNTAYKKQVEEKIEQYFSGHNCLHHNRSQRFRVHNGSHHDDNHKDYAK